MSLPSDISPNKIRTIFCDQLNLARGKYLPEDFASHGEARLCKGVFSVTYSRQLVNAPGGGLDEGLPDVVMQYDPADYRTSWEENTKIAVADVYENEAPSPLCGRSALKNVIDAWLKHGLEPMIGFEGEAYLLEETKQGLVPYTSPGSFVYGTGPFNDPKNLTDEIWANAARCGIQIESLNSEFDAPQYEMTLHYNEALKACDDFFLFKNMARETLYKKGYILSFLPKPLQETGGSGLHINISFRKINGGNALAGGTKPGNLSNLASGVIAGLLNHHEALGGVLAPTVNSYERLQAGSMCGYWANWGFDHRAVAVRVSGEDGPGARIEHRVGDCAASPYFAVAAVLRAALLGYENKYPLGEPEQADGFENVSVDRHIAANLTESLAALKADRVLCSALGEQLIENYCAIKETEIAELDGKSHDEIVTYYAHYI